MGAQGSRGSAESGRAVDRDFLILGVGRTAGDGRREADPVESVPSERLQDYRESLRDVLRAQRDADVHGGDLLVS